ncbi:GIY-YIG nuclease family protein [Prosthecobacter sp.]|uniref:GIY-YIG nuclease family protein n=1 Tax=Prosthecobacter sp. TaxID=1965333 RepID=UPI002ABC8E7F|nr:GIY-YIG nuclease family protein [Prosthecobacter sp.]MDZ4403558.1 GIY-YIG nuclease family protein [Prosthecobacter sp.]
MPKKKTPDARAKPAKKWCLYVLRCKDGTLYCGITNDLASRIARHDAGKGARYTRGRGPVKLLRSWPQKGKSAALKAEFAFKRLTRRAKDAFLLA